MTNSFDDLDAASRATRRRRMVALAVTAILVVAGLTGRKFGLLARAPWPSPPPVRAKCRRCPWTWIRRGAAGW